MDKRGTRGFVPVLRFLEMFRLEGGVAIKVMIARAATGFDDVKLLALCGIEQRPTRLDLKVLPIGRRS